MGESHKLEGTISVALVGMKDPWEAIFNSVIGTIVDSF